MNSDIQVVRIGEYDSNTISSERIDERDVAYLKKSCFKGDAKTPPFEVIELRDDAVKIRNTSYSGIIQLHKTRVLFSTKVKANLFYLLSFLRDEKHFLYDPEIAIDIKEGANFFDVLGRLFLNELEEVFKGGLSKKYVRRDENLRFLKGKLLFRREIQNNISKVPRFFCSYDDFTYNNLENQIVLRATTLLIPLIRFNEEIKRSLTRCSYLLRELVSLVDVVPEDCDLVTFSRLNEYYEPIMRFSKVILQNYFIRSVDKGEAIGFNFIVNMNKVYEDFVTAMVEEIVEKEPEFRSYIVEKQEKFDSLVRERKIVTKPDIILRNRNSGEHPLIVDAKYKRQEANADYYQVIAYALAIPEAKACCLIYPQDEPVESPHLTLDTSPFSKNGREVRLHAVRIDLFLGEGDEDLMFPDYIREVKRQIKGKLLDCL